MNKKIILWVEDEPELQNIRLRKLKSKLKEDIEILFVKDPQGAMGSLKSYGNNIIGVILDIMLPSGLEDKNSQSTFRSGVELAKTICNKYPAIKIVILTNLSKYTHTGKQIWAELGDVPCVMEALEKTDPISRFVNAVVKTFGVGKGVGKNERKNHPVGGG